MSSAGRPHGQDSHTLLRWTRFESDPHGTGGEKRTAQLTELIAKAGLDARPFPPTSPRRAAIWLEGVQARLRHGRNASVDHAGIGLLGYRALLYRRGLATHVGARVLSWETTYDDLLPALARAAGFTIIAAPHNLESLVSDRAFADATFDPMPALAAEINRLRLAHAVSTISREEQWLLQARGISAGYLPYFPAQTLVEELSAIRAARVARAQSDGRVAGPVLLLGSAFNPATARGMRRQLEWLSRGSASAPSVVVAGRDSDRILGEFARPGIEIRGTVSGDELDRLMTEAAALLVHTEGGGGALTRIPEALLAGVPVIANGNAARDQHGTNGVHVYHTPTEFLARVAAPPAIPPAPVRPEAAEARYMDQLRQAATAYAHA